MNRLFLIRLFWWIKIQISKQSNQNNKTVIFRPKITSLNQQEQANQNIEIFLDRQSPLLSPTSYTNFSPCYTINKIQGLTVSLLKEYNKLFDCVFWVLCETKMNIFYIYSRLSRSFTARGSLKGGPPRV